MVGLPAVELDGRPTISREPDSQKRRHSRWASPPWVRVSMVKSRSRPWCRLPGVRGAGWCGLAGCQSGYWVGPLR
jgi:hypothetical protein